MFGRVKLKKEAEGLQYKLESRKCELLRAERSEQQIRTGAQLQQNRADRAEAKVRKLRDEVIAQRCDVVKLKSGGPKMVVNSIQKTVDGKIALCTWFIDEGCSCLGSFALKNLSVVWEDEE